MASWPRRMSTRFSFVIMAGKSLKNSTHGWPLSPWAAANASIDDFITALEGGTRQRIV